MNGCDICGDNRFELVEKYRAKLIDGTNIEDRPEEMAVIDNVLFRFWQMGWLDQLEKRDNEFGKLKIENYKLREKSIHTYFTKTFMAMKSTALVVSVVGGVAVSADG